MNDRPRRQPATRRRVAQETVEAGGQQTSTTNHNTNHQHPINNNSHRQHHNLNHHPSADHQHASNNYYANFRQPSTTTTSSSNPSTNASSSQSMADDCAFSICYSYLIAIFSSFLVVLGLYLALTRFNVRYLYISLVGLSFEALGACIYCISNTRANKLTRRKQRISSANNNAYMLNGSTNNSGNSNININNLNPILLTNSHQTGQQPHASELNHILDNRIQTPNDNNSFTARVQDRSDTILSDSRTSNVANGNASNQNIPASSMLRVQPVDELAATLNESQNDNPILIANEEDSAIIINVLSPSQSAVLATTTSTLDSIACNTEQLPNIESCQTKSFEVTSSAPLPSSSCHLNEIDSLVTSDQLLQQTSLVGTAIGTSNNNTNNSTQNQNNVCSRSDQISGDNSSNTPSSIIVDTSEQQAGTSAESQQQQLISIDNSTSRLSTSNSIDLIQLSISNDDGSNNSLKPRSDHISPGPELSINTGPAPSHSGLVPSAPSDVSSMKRSPAQGQRNVHLRRTLVVGLGGEEELMEIDEDDLDNMSILPPSYESIAQNRF